MRWLTMICCLSVCFACYKIIYGWCLLDWLVTDDKTIIANFPTVNSRTIRRVKSAQTFLTMPPN